MAPRSLKKRNGEARVIETTSVPDFDRIIHERTRLAIVAALAANDHLSFKELKTIIDTTDGNISVHAHKLEQAKYVHTRKTFEGRVPRTEYSLTAAGRRAFDRYLDHMAALIKASRG